MPASHDERGVVRRDRPRYDEARQDVIWNKRLALARAPQAIIRCHSADEVAEAIRVAGADRLKVSPRGSGHHYEAAALRDGGLLLDLGAIDFVEIDARKRTAWVGAGIRGGALSARLAKHGLAFPVGHCADVALSGYILAGGFGWNAGEWGPACANVAAIEMITAAGDKIVASESEHPDLFWAARGAGPGFFAAITAYQLRLHGLPQTALAWQATFEVESAPVLADWLTAATAAADPSAEVICLVGADVHSGKPAVTIRAVAVGGDVGEARSRIASFHSPPAAAELLGDIAEDPMAFVDLTALSAMPDGKRVAADHIWSDSTMGDLLLRASSVSAAPSPHSTVNLVSLGGGGVVPSRAHGPHGALSVGGGLGAGIYAIWDDPADDEANRSWVRSVDEALSPLRSGRYVGEADLAADPERLSECFTPEALAHLAELRARYDPEGLFFAWP